MSSDTRPVTSTVELPNKSSKQSISWAKRQVERQKLNSAKALERQIKSELEAEAERRREAIKARRAKAAEKERLEKLSAKLSQKKLARMKKRLGRSKAISG
ncbi:hypothetical protein CROQUDRAFT_101007 [Cronartium quercuum f. sp. fusiforme G11]|uniref:rRNA-processing protein n=1 Tax=Cronartium quercuum f. sp. fusiforme G11 TaxID=708437 RepID=A0A9P6N9J9_9BASI|nr:hypothetical protein CROQUDRAFT_101007 [Cronartium quercuum f. sp. fusiforme G11]